MGSEVVRALAELQRRVAVLERPRTAAPTVPVLSSVTKTISDVRIADATANQALHDANNITETQITEGAIRSPHIAANAIDGKTITGATIRTGASAPNIFMGSSGLTGEPLLQGRASDASVWEIKPDAFGFWDPADDQRIRLNYGGLDLWSAAPVGAPGTWQSHSWLRSNALSFWDEGDVHWFEMSVRATYPQMRFRSNTAMSFEADGYGNVIDLNAAGVSFGHYIFANYFKTTTAAANLHRSSTDAQIYLVTSNGYNKLDQADIDLAEAEALLEVAPKTWVDRRDADNPDAQRVPGFVAEDVAAASQAHGGALDPLLTTGSDTLGTAYMGVNYDRVAAYLIPLIRDLRERVATLETA